MNGQDVGNREVIEMADQSIRGRYAGSVEHSEGIIRKITVRNVTDADGKPRILELQTADSVTHPVEDLAAEVERLRRDST